MKENKLKESFLMYINPDDRDMARGALEVLLKQDRESLVKKIEAKKIAFEWEEHKEDWTGSQPWRSCKNCSHLENDPECPHSCEVANMYYDDILSIIKE